MKKQLNYFGLFFIESFLLFTSYSNQPHIAVTGGAQEGVPKRRERDLMDWWLAQLMPTLQWQGEAAETDGPLPPRYLYVCAAVSVCLCACACVTPPWQGWHDHLPGQSGLCVHVCVWRKTGRDKRVIECWRRPGASEWTAATSWKIPVCTRCHAHEQGQIHTQGTGGPVYLLEKANPFLPHH